MSIMEQNETLTSQNLSMALKLLAVRFINTSIVVIIVNSEADKWFDKGGLASNIFYIFLSISFLDTIL